jgi:hypothetical protein
MEDVTPSVPIRKKKPSSEETRHRRLLIKKMVLEQGIISKEEIRKKLQEEHNIFVNRVTIHKDFKVIANVSDGELEVFEIDIMTIYKRLIFKLEGMIAKETDNIKKASLIKSLSGVLKDRQTVLSNIALREAETAQRKKSSKEEAEVVFE